MDVYVIFNGNGIKNTKISRSQIRNQKSLKHTTSETTTQDNLFLILAMNED